MGYAIEARVLYQDIEAMQKRARGRATICIGMGHIGNKPAPVELRGLAHKPKLESDLMHDYGGNWPGEQVLTREEAECANRP